MLVDFFFLSFQRLGSVSPTHFFFRPLQGTQWKWKLPVCVRIRSVSPNPQTVLFLVGVGLGKTIGWIRWLACRPTRHVPSTFLFFLFACAPMTTKYFQVGFFTLWLVLRLGSHAFDAVFAVAATTAQWGVGVCRSRRVCVCAKRAYVGRGAAGGRGGERGRKWLLVTSMAASPKSLTSSRTRSDLNVGPGRMFFAGCCSHSVRFDQNVTAHPRFVVASPVRRTAGLLRLGFVGMRGLRSIRLRHELTPLWQNRERESFSGICSVRGCLLHRLAALAP